MLATIRLWAFAVLWQLARCELILGDVDYWEQLQGAVIRRDLYLQGGFLQLKSGDQYVQESLFKVDLDEAFDISSNDRAPKLAAIGDNAQTSGLIGQDGYMFADYDEFYSYAGAFIDPAQVNSVVLSDVLYEASNNESLEKPNPGYQPKLPGSRADLVYKLRAGAGANAPSENLAFYFGGIQGTNNEVLGLFADNTTLSVSPSLITVNTSDSAFSSWRYDGLGEGIRARAGAIATWIPSGKMGLLVVVGGVLSPRDIFDSGGQGVYPPEYEEGNNFTTEILVYDIDQSRWYKQAIPTQPDLPPRLARSCAVVATYPRSGVTHHDIFIYGGYDGAKTTSTFSDVWVLNIPTFRWIKLGAASGRFARMGHLCVKPDATQMIVVGGTKDGVSVGDNAVLDVFNLTALEWSGKYDPTSNETYTPNAQILGVLPEDPWENVNNTELRNLLNTNYTTSKIRQFPYTAPTSTETTSPTSTPTPNPSKDNNLGVKVGVPVGVVGGLAIVGILLFCCIKRRRAQLRKEHRNSAITSETAKRSWVDRWVGTTAASAHPKDLGSETDGAPSVPPPMSETTQVAQPHEMDARWSLSTAVGRPSHYREVSGDGPQEVYTPDHRPRQLRGLHEAEGSYGHVSGTQSPDSGKSPDIRQHPMYPASVVSGGHAPSEASEAISQPSEAAHGSETGDRSVTSASVYSSPPTASRSPKAQPISSILETAAFGTYPGDSSAPRNTNRDSDISPILSPQRPGHRRHNSSMSSGMSPLPSPGEEDPQNRTI